MQADAKADATNKMQQKQVVVDGASKKEVMQQVAEEVHVRCKKIKLMIDDHLTQANIGTAISSLIQ
jgi:hypothetical protein